MALYKSVTPKITPDLYRLPPHPLLEAWQQTFLGRDEIGHIAHLTYINSNPSEDVVIVFEPKRPSTVISKGDAERIARFSFLPSWRFWSPYGSPWFGSFKYMW
ncbi:MAG: hypothetical protein ACUVTP_06595 [Candidatus Fervidibacter sp.]|uniref:hypothetical protein n=1 Tax=Candidatus Fervidibacter sp. TaxID=3100871 RepID=UPI004049D093